MNEGTPLSHSMDNAPRDQSCISYGEYNMQVPQRIARMAPQVEFRRDQVSAIPRKIQLHPPVVPGVASQYQAAMPFGNQETLNHLLVGEYYHSR